MDSEQNHEKNMMKVNLKSQIGTKITIIKKGIRVKSENPLPGSCENCTVQLLIMIINQRIMVNISNEMQKLVEN